MIARRTECAAPSVEIDSRNVFFNRALFFHLFSHRPFIEAEPEAAGVRVMNESIGEEEDHLKSLNFIVGLT